MRRKITNDNDFRLPCQMPKDYTWWAVYRFDSSSVVIMPFLKAPMFNDYQVPGTDFYIILKPVPSTF